METISTRGDIVEKMREVLTTKVTCPKQVQRDVLVEVILMKYNLSFEHTLHYLRRVRPILDEFLQTDGAAQAEALALILKAYHLDDLSAQDYDSDVQNLFQVRKKVIYLVLKLVDLGLMQASNLIPYCVNKISEHLANPDAAKLD